MSKEYAWIQETADYLRKQGFRLPEIGIVTGSGLGGLTKLIHNPMTIPFARIPHFPALTTEGHQGKLVFGELNGKSVLVMQGRYHFYEGFTLQQIGFPIRIFRELGIKTLILTNACGAINSTFEPGDLMVLTDHLNVVGQNPLIGENVEELGPRFPDAGEIYSKSLIEAAFSAAESLQICLRKGVYAWWSGPSYETPAEIRMLRCLGADAVGMSTVPEALVASHMGMKVLAIACLTNMATGIREAKLTHEEVLTVAAQAEEKYLRLIPTILNQI